jgi:Sigma-70 region 2
VSVRPGTIARLRLDSRVKLATALYALLALPGAGAAVRADLLGFNEASSFTTGIATVVASFGHIEWSVLSESSRIPLLVFIAAVAPLCWLSLLACVAAAARSNPRGLTLLAPAWMLFGLALGIGSGTWAEFVVACLAAVLLYAANSSCYREPRAVRRHRVSGMERAASQGGIVDEALAGRSLVDLARGGDAAAFETLVRSRMDAMYRLGLAILGDEADAADAAQMTFLTAWRGLPGLRDPNNFDAWLQRVAVNSCRMVLRARGRQPDTGDADGPP